jgi:hypothetical protein
VDIIVWAVLGVLGILTIVAGAIFVGWRIAKGHSKLEESRTVIDHSHIWSPWEAHEAALYDGATLVRYAPGQLRTCLDMSCAAEDIRLIGGQTTSGEKDL